MKIYLCIPIISVLMITATSVAVSQEPEEHFLTFKSQVEKRRKKKKAAKKPLSAFNTKMTKEEVEGLSDIIQDIDRENRDLILKNGQDLTGLFRWIVRLVCKYTRFGRRFCFWRREDGESLGVEKGTNVIFETYATKDQALKIEAYLDEIGQTSIMEDRTPVDDNDEPDGIRGTFSKKKEDEGSFNDIGYQLFPMTQK